MKKVLLTMLGVAGMLCSTSCSDEEIVSSVEGDAVAQFTVELSDGSDASRAISDGLSVTDLYYEVYSQVEGQDPKLMENLDAKVTLEKVTVDGKEVRRANVSLALVKGQAYDVVFWAQTPGAYVTDVANKLTEISIPATTANNEAKDAFTAVYRTAKVTGPIKETIKLTRPFAQVNFGTTFEDFAAAELAGINFEEKRSCIVVSSAASTYNALTEKASATGTEREFSYAILPTYSGENAEVLEVSGKDYKYLATAYVLVPEGATLADLTMKIETGLNDTIILTVPTAPVQRNFRTNVLGNLLTNQAEFNIVVDPIYNTPDNDIMQWDGKTEEVTENAEGVYEIKTPAQLAWVAEQVDNGETFKDKTFKLVADIDLDNKAWNPIGTTGDTSGFQGVFDGNGHTIYNLNVDLTKTPAYQSAGLFANARYATIKNFTIENAVVKNLITGSATSCGTAVVVGSAQFTTTVEGVTVKNAVVEGNRYVGGIAGFYAGTIEGCKVEGIQLTATPDDLDKNGVYDNGDKVGGIIGYVNTAGTVTNNTVNNFSIKGYRDLGAIVGGNYADLSGNKATNGVVTIDQTLTPYNEFPKAANAGEIVGRQLGGNVAGDNVAENVEVKQIVVSNVSLQSALDNMAKVGNYILTFANDIAGDVTVTEKQDVKVVINGDNKKYDGTINIYGNSVDENAELVVKNVNFETSTKDEVFVYGFNTGTGDYSRYPDAVTVEKCTFTATGEAVHTAAGIKLAAGRDNFKIIGCTATNMHSLAQFQSHDKTATVDGAILNNCKNGVSFGNTAEAVLINSTINSAAYGVRGDGDGRNCKLTVENSTINSKLPVVVRKMTNAEYSYAVKLDGATKLEGAENYDVVFTKGQDDAAPVTPIGTWSIEGAEGYVVYPRDYAVTTSEELLSALADTNIKSIYLKAGDYEMGIFNASSREVSIKGESAEEVTLTGSMHIVGGTNNFSLENVTFEWDGTNNGVAVPIELKETKGLISFKNCVFSGANQKPTGNFGFIYMTSAVEHINVEGCTFDKCAQRFGIFGHLAGNATTTSKIINNKFIGTSALSGLGMGIEGPKTIQNIEIIGNNITEYFRIVTSGSDYTLKNIAIEDNTLSQNLAYVNANTTIENVTFKNNKKANGSLWTSPNSKFITE